MTAVRLQHIDELTDGRVLEGKIEDPLWKEMMIAGLMCGARMLLWTKGNALRADREGAREEWQWWSRHLEYWAAARLD